MNRYFFFIGLLFIVAPAPGQDEKVNQLHSSALHSILKNDQVTLIDVRTRSEFANGRIEDAGHLNYYAIDFKKKLLLLPKDKPVYLYCNTGYRSQRAAEILI
ncbi:MAG: rhodanese-like domain-containing protein [Bacteroidales bacterium]|nr:rhodanese-like domain-containing protein [Bacteroidales bacterium]